MTQSCPACGAVVATPARFCDQCGRALAAAGTAPPATSGGAVLALIPYHNQPALIGYYCAVFSLIPCLGLPLGVTALVLGVIGLRKQRSDPTVKGKVHAWVAIVLGGLTTLAWGGLLGFWIFAASA